MDQSSEFHDKRIVKQMWADYLCKMYLKERVIAIMGIDQCLGIATLLLARNMTDVEEFHKRPLLSVPQDYPEGRIAYIDYLIAKKWDTSMRKMIQELIELKFPKVELGYWYRPGRDTDRVKLCYRKGGQAT